MTEQNIIDFESVLAPISDDRPCGIDLRATPETTALLEELRCLRSAALTLEKRGCSATDSADAGVVGRPSAWEAVAKMAVDVLTRRSKDIGVAMWLLEALVRTSGFGGCLSGVRLVRLLCEWYWDELFPLCDLDGRTGRLAAFATLSDEDHDGRVASRLLDVPMTLSSRFGCFRACDLCESESGRVNQATLQSSVSDTPSVFLGNTYRNLVHSLEELRVLGVLLSHKCSTDELHGATLSATTQTLLSCARIVRELARRRSLWQQNTADRCEPHVRRVRQYLQDLADEHVGHSLGREQLEEHLNECLHKYVRESDGLGHSNDRRVTLGNAHVSVTEVPGEPGRYRADVQLRPWLQFEGLSATLSLVARIPTSPTIHDMLGRLRAWAGHSSRRPGRKDAVDCTAFAPTEVGMGKSFIVQVIAHVPAHDLEARQLATECDGDATRRGFTSLETEVRRGSRLLFHLVMPGLQVDHSWNSLTWWGEPAAAQFVVQVPVDYSGGDAIGTVTISQEQVPLGRIVFKIRMCASPSDVGRSVEPTGTAKSLDYFFISYASEDRLEVLKRVQMLNCVGKRFFQDVLHLDPGDRWEQKLYERINECDAVLLFWSSNAKKSEWVLRECLYAIKKKGLEHLLPVIIEGPPPVKPPVELEALHLDDPLLYVIEGVKSSRGQRTDD